jgi:hypothetical protein
MVKLNCPVGVGWVGEQTGTGEADAAILGHQAAPGI